MTIKIKNLSKTFSKYKKLQFPDFESNNISILLLRGSSGSGKTTFLKILSGLDSHFDGKVKISVSSKQTGYYFHDYELIPELSVIENIFLGNREKIWNKNIEEKEKEIFQIAEYLSIDQLIGQNIKTLSSGQYQRICLLRAFVGEKIFFLLDEPTSHLDNVSSQKVLEYIKLLAEKGNIIAVSSHDNKVFSFFEKHFSSQKIITIDF